VCLSTHRRRPTPQDHVTPGPKLPYGRSIRSPRADPQKQDGSGGTSRVAPLKAGPRPVPRPAFRHWVDRPRQKACRGQTLCYCALGSVGVHHLGPGRGEVLDELALRVGHRIDLREGPQFGVGAEDQVDAGGGPARLAALAVVAGEGVDRRRAPGRAHVQQVDEEVVGQHARAVVKTRPWSRRRWRPAPAGRRPAPSAPVRTAAAAGRDRPGPLPGP
jgi:hypothetical protein